MALFTELYQRTGFNLADPFAADFEDADRLFQRDLASVIQTEPQTENLLFPAAKDFQRAFDLLAQHSQMPQAITVGRIGT